MEDIEIHFNAPENATPTELAAYLDKACGGDSDLRARVEALFTAGEESRGFMAEAPLSEFSADDDVGETIDNYKLLQKIGEGGFGVVYMAEQSVPVKRRVALKIIKLGMDTKQVIARFEIERQALAMMDHPNIAKVYDAGATELGRPFFVMELVRGIPITKFCQDQKLGTRERLELFVEVCSAVQHAHQKGIIHRDLKPSNVMVTLHDDKAVPKVIDFGVAKATQQDLTDKTLFTRFEQFIGTPAYMSPEQAQMSGLDIDTRSDIYSLGALLYELLTGTTPFDAREMARAGDQEIRRLIREEEPPKPSTRFTQLQKRTNQEDVNLPPVMVSRDLDWIVMKAMEKDRTRRYDTAKGLGMDLQRFMEDEPIEAAPPGAWYRFQKYARRYRGALGTAAVVVLSLVVGTVVSVWQAIEADAQRDKSQVAEQRERDAKDEAKRLEMQSRHLAFEELLAAGKQRLGMARLAQLVRDDKDNRIAAARLLSALQFREFPQSIQRGPIAYFPNLSPDRNLVITTTEDEQGFQVWNVLTGEKVGKVLRPSSTGEARSTVRGGAFHPSQPKVATFQNNDRKNNGFAQLWDYGTGEPIGDAIQFPRTVKSVQFTPDGRYLVTASRNGEIILTDADDGSHHSLLPERFKGKGSIVSVAISPDSRMMALDRVWNVSIVDLTTRELIAEPFPGGGRIHWSVCFRPDSKVVARAGEDGKVRFWNAETRELLPTVLIDDDTIDEVEYSPDGRLLSTASRSGVAKVWDVESGEAIMETVKYPSFVHKAKFDQTGRFLVTFSDDVLQVWDIGTGKPVGAPGQSPMNITHADFGPGGDSVFFCGPGGASRLNTIKPTSPNAMKFHHPRERTWSKEGDLVGRGDISPDGRWVATGGNDGTVRVWDRVTGVPVVKPLDFTGSGRILWVEFSPDGKLLLASCETSQGVGVWDTTSWERKPEIKAGSCFYATFAPFKDTEGRWRIVNAGAAQPQIWDAETGEKIGNPLGEIQRITRTMVDAVQWSSDGKWVLTITNGNEALLWDAETSRLIRRFDGELGQVGHQDFLRSASFSPDDSRILTCGNDQTAILWETATGLQIGQKMVHGDDITFAAFSPDGKLVVTVSRDTTARLWNAETGEPVGIPLQHGSWVAHAAFDPDSKRVVTASDDGTARVWDCATGLPLSEPLHHGGQVFYASFSSDGLQVLTAGRGGAAKLWDIPALPEGDVPEWLGEWAEAIVGLRFESSGATSEVNWEGPEEIEKRMRSEAAGDEFYERFVDWFYTDPLTRPIGPNFELTLDGYVENRMREKDANGKRDLVSLEEVLRVKPRHVPAYVAMAERLWDEEKGDREANLRRASYYARLAHQAHPDDSKMAELSEWVEATLEEKAKLAEISLLEETAAGFIRKGSELQGQLLADQAALALLEKATKERWPSEGERLAPLENWLAVQTPQVLVARGSTWKFNDPAKGMVPDNWKDSDFDDSDWQDGQAPLGFSKSGEDGEVTKLEKGEKGSERVTFYFRHQFEHNPSGVELSGRCLSLRLRRDDGAIVYLNGEEILRSNMSDAKVLPTTFASKVVGGQNEKEFFWHLADPELLREGENVLAVEVHQANLHSSDVMFDLEVSLVRDPEPFFQSMMRERAWSLKEEAFLNWIWGDEEEALGKVEAVLKSLPKSYDPAEVRRRKEWLRHKASILYALERWKEAESAGEEAMSVPPRDPELDPKLIDLTRLYHGSWFQQWSPQASSHREAEEMLAETYHPGDGPEFDLRGYIQLNSGMLPAEGNKKESEDFNARTNEDRPMKVSIPVGQSCRKIHFLQGCRWGRAEIGVEVASYLIHFDDGSSEKCSVEFGVDMTDFWLQSQSAERLAGIKDFAWQRNIEVKNGTQKIGLTRQVWEIEENAGKVITHIEFVSAGGEAAPLLVAVTLE